MQPRIRPNQYWGVTAAGLLLLLTGCTSLQRASSPIQLELSERDLYQVRALAHFGQALIYEDADGAISPRTLAAYTDAAELDPVYHPIFAKMATAHLISNRADEAIAILERSCKATPNSVMARMDLASAYHYLGNTNAAVNHFQKALAMDPTNTPIYFTLASLLIEAKRYDKAIELIERGLQHADQPERLRTYAYSLGLEFIERGDSIHSLAFFRLVVEYAQTKKSEIYHLMGQLYEGFNMRQEAIDCYESATRHPAPMPQTFVRLALLYIDSDLARSIQILIDSADVLPNDPLPLLALGQIYSNRGRYDEALATYERLETISRNNAEWRLPPAYYLHYGSTAERAGLFELAERLFETCISTYPNSHQVLNYLAYMWADRGIKLEKALQYVNRALIHEPQNGAYLDTRGWIYYMQGDYQEALIHIEAASKLIPEDPTINDHLGDIWSALGDRTRAVQHWSQSYIRDTANTTVANKLQANGVDPDSLQPAIEPTEDN